jgi:hypothetical protein
MKNFAGNIGNLPKLTNGFIFIRDGRETEKKPVSLNYFTDIFVQNF